MIYSNGDPSLYNRMKYLVDNKLLPAGVPFVLSEGSYGIILLIGYIYSDYTYGEFLILGFDSNYDIFIAQINHSLFFMREALTETWNDATN